MPAVTTASRSNRLSATTLPRPNPYQCIRILPSLLSLPTSGSICISAGCCSFALHAPASAAPPPLRSSYLLCMAASVTGPHPRRRSHHHRSSTCRQCHRGPSENAANPQCVAVLLPQPPRVPPRVLARIFRAHHRAGSNAIRSSGATQPRAIVRHLIPYALI